LPEPIRGHEAWKDVPDVPTLASKYLETRKPFAEQLPPDIAADASFKDIKDLAGLAKSYHGQVKLLGVPKDQLLRLPTDDKPENWDPVYNRLGRPEKADGYKLTLPDGAKQNDAIAKPLFEAAHKLGVSQKQLDGLYTTMRTLGEQQLTAQQGQEVAAAKQSEDALRTEWGAAADQKIRYSQNAMEIAAKEAGVPYEDLKAQLDKTGLGNNTALIKIFEKQAQKNQEDGIQGKATGADALSSPMEAKQQINALMQDTNFKAAYLTRNHAGHKDAVAKMEALYKLANPEQSQAA
jgi:hypothetical protein